MICSAYLSQNEAEVAVATLRGRGYLGIDDERRRKALKALPRNAQRTRVLYETTIRARLGGVRIGEFALVPAPEPGTLLLCWNQPEKEDE